MTERENRVELESKIAFLEHTLDTLNDVVVSQGRSLEALERKLALLESRVRSRESGEAEEARDLADDKPPHY